MLEVIGNLGVIASIFVVIISLGIIIKGADYFVKGASSLSLKLGVSVFVIGLTVVAVGTSAPELFINGIAAYSGATDLSIGNILGSNIAGILLGLGISAIFVPLVLNSKTVWKEIPFSLLGATIVLIFGMDIFIDGGTENIITRSEGLILLAFFIIFVVYTFGLGAEKEERKESGEEIKEYSALISTGYIIGGLIALVLGGNLIVESASTIAASLGLTQNLIGLTVVAAGTSLPEIVTAIVAARKGQVDLVVGGIIGTIIFNIFFALGVTAVIAELPFKNDNIVDAGFLMFITILFFLFMFIGKKNVLSRIEGIIFVVLYISYIAFAVLREIL